MVTAEYSDKDHEHVLTLRGHAGAAPKGEDLICAGVTTLVEALAACLLDMRKKKLTHKCLLSLGDGVAAFDVIGGEGAKDLVAGAFSTTVAGLQWLSDNYPDFVKFKIL